MEKIEKIANDIFNRFKNKEKVFITSDGQAFFVEADAKNHALKNRTGKELKLEVFLREGKKSPKVEKIAETGKTATVLISEINAATEIELISEILEAETAGSNRKSVIEAAKKKIEQLTQNQ